MFHKQFDRAISEIMMALDLDPLSLIINRDIGQIYLFSHRYDAAIDAFERTLDIDPHFPGTRGFIGSILLALGEDDGAIQWYERAYRDRDSNILYMTLGPATEGFRSAPRYLTLLRKLGLPE
jgi:tetratricopeptide (TPR) repeat protein